MRQFLRVIFGNFTLKLFALVFALFLWTVAVLDRAYEVQIVVPVRVLEKGNPERVISDIDFSSVEVTLTGRGKELLRLPRQALEFRPVVPEGRFGTRQVRLNPADLKLPAGVAVRSIEPEVIEVKLGPARTKEVTVAVPTRGQAPAGMMVADIQVKNTVQLFGPADRLDGYDKVFTETLDLSTVRSGETRRLRVMVPQAGGFSCVPESVDVVVVLEKEAARIFLGLPVQVVAPPTFDVQVSPSEAQVAVAGPAERIESLKPADINVQVKIAGLQPGEYRLAADVLLPERFRLVKIEPLLFDVTVR